jgi:hypothetical protein
MINKFLIYNEIGKFYNDKFSNKLINAELWRNVKFFFTFNDKLI